MQHGGDDGPLGRVGEAVGAAGIILAFEDLFQNSGERREVLHLKPQHAHPSHPQAAAHTPYPPQVTTRTTTTTPQTRETPAPRPGRAKGGRSTPPRAASP